MSSQETTSRPVDQETILEAFESGSPEAIIAICREAHPGDIETAFERLDASEREEVLNALPAEVIGEIGDYLPAADLERRLRDLSEVEQRDVLDSMSDDELVDLLQEASKENVTRYIDLLPEEKQEASESLLQFPENTAGGRMTQAIGKLNEKLSIRQAIIELEAKKDEPEFLSRIYIVDDQGRLVGKVRLRDLAFNPRKRLLSEIMDSDQVAINAMADQEEAAEMIRRYDMVALPVVDDKFRLLGAITHDDALDIYEEETTEDIERASGIAGERGDQAYLQTSVLTHAKRRFFWVLFLAFLALISGLVLHSYESIFTSYYVLALYLPMVVAAGGNTGAQAATMIIRSMSLGELVPSEFFRVAWKEMRVGLLLGSLLGLCIALQIRFFLPGGFSAEGEVPLLTVSAIVGLSLTVQVMSSTLIGAALPLGARAIRLDPAVVASPAITTLVDVTGMIIYFNLAHALLTRG